MQKLTRSFAMAGALAFAGVLAGCGDDVTVPQTLEVTVTPASANVAVGASVTLTASVTGTNPNKNITWASSDPTKATVDAATGKVTGVAVGQTTVTATAAADAGVKGSALINVTTPDKGVQKVEISPPNAILKAGDFLQANANVTRNPGVSDAVTWSSSATSVATVDAATGKITAVANGTATITAKSTVDPTVSGSMALTVRPIQLAQISIKSVTQGGTNTPVNFNNVTGQIDVVLNVDPGEERVTKVDVNFDGTSACTRNLSASESDALRLAGAFENVEAVDIVCSINTADFSTTTGAVKFTNGAHVLAASATIAGPPARTITATDQAITLNNASGFIAKVENTNTNTGFPNSAINPTSGQNWVQGNTTLTLTAVNYAAGGATVAAVSGSFLTGGTQAVPATHVFTQVAPAAGTQVFTITYPNTGTTAFNTVAYQSPNAGEFPLVTGSVLSNGQAGPINILNLPATAPALGLTPLAPTRLDNVAPAAAATNTGFPTWVNAAFSFTPSAIYAAGADAGVDAVKTDFYYILGALPTTGGACDVTGMTKVAKGSDIPESIISNYRARAVSYDALGNKTCADMSVAGGTPFGADFTPPANVTFAGVADLASFNSTATAAGTNYVLASTGDNASGISATTPGLVSIVRVNSTGPNTCVVGATTACNQTAAAGTASITGGATVEGYYTITSQLTDNAANVAPATPFVRTFLVDATAPSFTGNVGMAAQYAGNAPAAFTNLLITDNLDLSKLFGRVNYTNLGNLQYADQSIGAFGLPLEKTFNGTYTIPSLIRCINAAGDFTLQAGSEATQVTFFGVDQAGNQGTVSPVAGALQAALDNCGAVGNLTAPAAITAFADSAVNYGTGKTQVSIAGTTTTVNSASVGLTAVTTVTLDNAPEPFTRVEFYYEQSAGNWVKIGQSAAGVLNQTVTTRTWTYKFTWDPDATVPVNATTNVIALGIDAQGDAVRTAGITVNVAP
jgi:hypothetical protein